MTKAITLFAIRFLISAHFASTLTNFNHNPTCLLMSTLRSENKHSDLTLQYDNHLSFVHRSALVVMHLPFNITINTFFSWKTTCIEIVTFFKSGDPNVFLHDLQNWGYQRNVVMYTIFPVLAHNNLISTDFFSRLTTFYAPVYLIELYFGEDGIKVYTGLLHPTEFILPLTKSWVPSLMHYDCENHRFFVSTGRRCFAAQGPLQLLRKKLNITFVPEAGDWHSKFTEFSVFQQSESLRLGIGVKRHIEKTIDYYVLYCQENPTLLSLKISQFFTIIDPWIWAGSVLLSLFLGISKLGGYSDIAAAFVKVSVLDGRRLSWFGLLCIVAMIAVSSSYDAIITTDITTPLEKYVVATIRELLKDFGFKLYGSSFSKDTTKWHLSVRKLPNEDDHVWKEEILPHHTFHEEFSGAAVFADSIAFDPMSDYIRNVLYFLKRHYTNVTCNVVKEIFYKRNIIWEFKYPGAEGLYRNLQWLSSNGLFQLYATLWRFVDEANIRKHPVVEQKGIGALENLFVAFQLYLIFIPLAILGFFGEIMFRKVHLNTIECVYCAG
ncbi:hypothetical protein Fcan01_16654 [Folsomia candida]|uniref:Uncharacterized protein n=1 Tax=Folsomia candida TaxID=158441 RepID=A0A226DUF1_FOLCA|nr:hypothetical protein Fcan01_16654 [Folsomia candida]